jgi:1-hydroxycarotenoid 3,4-desaturase
MQTMDRCKDSVYRLYMVRSAERVTVVGGGIGGLACAIDLAAKGFAVTVFEREGVTGGKLRTLEVAGQPIDAGPTVLTMRWVFEELFRDAGADLDAHVSLSKAEVLARHGWSDGATVDLFADRDRSAAAIASTFGDREARAYLQFWEDGRRIFETVQEPFLRAQRPTVTSILKHTGVRGLGALARIDAFRTMWSAIVGRFQDVRLQQLFGRYATYCGSSPFDAPATLNLVHYVEAEGVWRVKGGMIVLRRALETVASGLGVEFRRGHAVDRIVVQSGRAAGVVCQGVLHEADAVVFNGDVSAIGSGLLGKEVTSAARKTNPNARSLSAVTFALVGRTTGMPLVHHNVFFSDDYTTEFEQLKQRRAPDAPTVYLCAQDREDTDDPLSEERMLLVINAPATGDEPDRWGESERKRCEQTTFETMRKCGLHIEAVAMEQTTPVEFERMFPATGGALYGPTADGPLSGPSRQAASSPIPGLYFAGGSVHPGPGIPMAALSGRLAAARIQKDFASIVRSRRTATRGTTSMP